MHSTKEFNNKLENNFHAFKNDIKGIELPEKFTFPFYYTPHELTIQAANQLKKELKRAAIQHNFGLGAYADELLIGKMFGVLVVQNLAGEIGFLRAFSGKLANSNHHLGFVPPVFDILTEDGLFRTGEKEVEKLTAKIVALEKSDDLASLRLQLKQKTKEQLAQLQTIKATIKQNKIGRSIKRETLKLSDSDLEDLRKTSVSEQYFLKKTTQDFKNELVVSSEKVQLLEVQIEEVKEERRQLSAAIQKQLFASYSFLDSTGKSKDLNEIFDSIPNANLIAGAGECCAPKLLQYAYLNNLKPLCMAEFWWGESPKSEIRVHEQYYPACRGKCEPILGHMLQGLKIESNPLIEGPDENIILPILYEDDFLLAINKPAEFLSVPGKTILDSVYTRMQKYLPEATGPLVIHRLDMSTSGILLIAKDLETYKRIQKQFIKHSVNKRYFAILEGEITQESGAINLPLRVDLEDRPRQLVCYEHGKKAFTEFSVLRVENGRTWIHFYPKTGRTHQLRVHAAHNLGLNASIVGDDLYGTKSERLCLHAEYIEFYHPWKKERMEIECKIAF